MKRVFCMIFVFNPDNYLERPLVIHFALPPLQDFVAVLKRRLLSFVGKASFIARHFLY